MSQSIEEVADTYQTYRVLSEDADFEFPVTEIYHSTKRLFLGVQADDTTFYIRILTDQTSPNKQFATLEDIFGEHEFTLESFIGENVTIHIEESLENSTLKGDSFSAEFSITQDHPTETHNADQFTPETTNTPDYWDEFAQNCATSYWYYSADEIGDHGRKTQIDSVNEVSDESVKFTLATGRVQPVVSLPIPKNADKENNKSAEFIEDCSGDIQLMDGASVVLVPTTENVERKMDGFLTEFEDFAVYSPDQYDSYVDGYTEPTSSTSNSYSGSSSTSHSSRSSSTRATGMEDMNNGARMMRFGVVFLVQYILFTTVFESFVQELFSSMPASSTATTETAIQLLNMSFGLFGIAGALGLVFGAFNYLHN